MTSRVTWAGALVVTIVLGAGAVACSSSNDNGNSGGDGGTKQQPPASLKSGSVTVVNQWSYVNYTASASFADATGANGDGAGLYDCQVSTQGNCQLQTCSLVPIDGGYPVNPKFEQAGAIDISGGQLSPPATLSPGADAKYQTLNGRSAAWSQQGGEDIKIHAHGSSEGVPEFDGTVKAPSVVKFSLPTWGPSTTGPTMDRSKDLDLAWDATGTPTGNVRVTVTAYTPGVGKSQVITCTQPATDAKGKVPASLLGQLPAGRGDFAASVVQETDLTPGDWHIGLLLVSPAGTTDGGAAMGSGILL